jgi:riboflavin synthase
MFTGLVQGLATVIEIRPQPPGMRLLVAAAPLSTAEIGDSVALNGCCLTVVERQGNQVAFEAGPETLARTNLGRMQIGGQVNFERSLRVGDQLGGHFVTGHVDGQGTLLARHDDRDWSTCWFGCDAALTQQMASKGSIAVDGVSLTLVEVASERFSVALIPHTLAMTTLGNLKVGDPVNLETDLLAKYVQRISR